MNHLAFLQFKFKPKKTLTSLMIEMTLVMFRTKMKPRGVAK